MVRVVACELYGLHGMVSHFSHESQGEEAPRRRCFMLSEDALLLLTMVRGGVLVVCAERTELDAVDEEEEEAYSEVLEWYYFHHSVCGLIIETLSTGEQNSLF
jgi:hypothetical protein